MARTKYVYLYVLQGYYPSYGWEDLDAVDKAEPGALKYIRESKRIYSENDGGIYRIISRREPR